MAVDVEHGVAALPGTGTTPVTFIHTLDIAEFVAASLDLPKWDEESYIAGDSVTWNEFLKLAEEVRGIKFQVTYDSIEDLRAGKVTELPSHTSMYSSEMPKEFLQGLMSTFGKFFHEGLFDLRPSKALNQLFPEIKVMSVREVLEKAWGKA